MPPHEACSNRPIWARQKAGSRPQRTAGCREAGQRLHAERAPGGPPPVRAAPRDASAAACRLRKGALGDRSHGSQLPRGRELRGRRVSRVLSRRLRAPRALPAALGAHPAGGPERCCPTRCARRTSTLHTEGVTFTVYSNDEEGHRARLAARPAAAHHPRRRVGADRGRPEAARAGAQPLPRGPLRRAARPQGRRRARRS